ncbi:uncharacterized protein LOC110007879 [Amborella trichopoda]|uniref:uncharacterized protein LOC110007879 n=1 Tax=Amborella trichopoda TaxID=13333 RepID=UPI0009BE76D2|nr:uncharacterized protein LOC110007879 [Amborella trichopoda]|eukprot:XP_020527433.1 uncharacterized protein LOC110007879 [Amborella trichopoda]
MSKPDRFLVSGEWSDFFLLASVKALPKLFSDHSPIVLCSKVLSTGPKPLRFEAGWLAEKKVLNLSKSAKENSISIDSMNFQLHKKLLSMKHKLLAWKNDKGFNVKKKIEEVLSCLTEVESRVQNSGVLLEELVLVWNSKINELHELRKVEEVYWKQRSIGQMVKGRGFKY